MKTFKNYFQEPYIPENPIHFKHVLDESVATQIGVFGLDNGAQSIQEKVDIGSSHIYHWSGVDDKTKNHMTHDEMFNHNENITRSLHNGQLRPDSKHMKYLKKYTDDSKTLNKHLVKSHKENKPISEKYKNTVEHLDHLTNKKLPHDVHLYSGVGSDRISGKDHNGLIHLPSYSSMTHDKHIARGFAKETKDENGKLIHHILHVHVKKGQKGYHAGEYSYSPHERETILPRNTQLKVHPEPSVYHDNNGGEYHVHHAIIHHQED